MSVHARLIAAAALASLAGLAHAGPTGAEMRLLFGFRVQLACIQQDARYEKTTAGALLASGEAFKGWDKLRDQPIAHCLGERRFLDKALCDDITMVSLQGERDDSTRAMNDALDRHLDKLDAADDVLYLEDDFRAAPATLACPATPPSHAKDRR